MIQLYMTQCMSQSSADIEQIRNDVYEQTWYRSQHEDRKQKHKIDYYLFDEFNEEDNYWEE
jgi:hypothetical protein